jgi:hypothetical protein
MRSPPDELGVTEKWEGTSVTDRWKTVDRVPFGLLLVGVRTLKHGAKSKHCSQMRFTRPKSTSVQRGVYE